MASINDQDNRSKAPNRADEIVDAAIPIFLRFGYKRAAMDEVAAATKLSRQAVYLHFASKDALFGAVVNRLCELTREIANEALWRSGLTLDEQLLAAFNETMPQESMELLSELLATAKELVPQSVTDIDALMIREVSARLSDALGHHQWPVKGVTVEQTAGVLQAMSYGLKQQTNNRTDYLDGMQSAIVLILVASGLMPPAQKPHQQSVRDKSKGKVR